MCITGEQTCSLTTFQPTLAYFKQAQLPSSFPSFSRPARVLPAASALELESTLTPHRSPLLSHLFYFSTLGLAVCLSDSCSWKWVFSSAVRLWKDPTLPHQACRLSPSNRPPGGPKKDPLIIWRGCDSAQLRQVRGNLLRSCFALNSDRQLVLTLKHKQNNSTELLLA